MFGLQSVIKISFIFGILKRKYIITKCLFIKFRDKITEKIIDLQEITLMKKTAFSLSDKTV